MHLMYQLMDEVQFDFTEDSNTLVMVKRDALTSLSAEAADSAGRGNRVCSGEACAGQAFTRRNERRRLESESVVTVITDFGRNASPTTLYGPHPHDNKTHAHRNGRAFLRAE